MILQKPYCNSSFFKNSLNVQNAEMYKMLICIMGEDPSSGGLDIEKLHCRVISGTRDETLPWLRHHVTMALLF